MLTLQHQMQWQGKGGEHTCLCLGADDDALVDTCGVADDVGRVRAIEHLVVGDAQDDAAALRGVLVALEDLLTDAAVRRRDEAAGRLLPPEDRVRLELKRRERLGAGGVVRQRDDVTGIRHDGALAVRVDDADVARGILPHNPLREGDVRAARDVVGRQAVARAVDAEVAPARTLQAGVLLRRDDGEGGEKHGDGGNHGVRRAGKT